MRNVIYISPLLTASEIQEQPLDQADFEHQLSAEREKSNGRYS